MKTSFTVLLKTAIVFCTIVCFASCTLTSSENADKKISREKGKESKYDDIESAIAYEFNMVKNPATGKIPEGIRELEMAQANDIRRNQASNTSSFANAYLFEGPDNLGGRTRALAYDIRYNGGSNQVIIAGGVSGGIYKSTDNGATWTRKSPIGQHFSVTSVAQDPRVGFQDTWYYSTGEASGNSAGEVGAFYTGNGVYKSTDNGETWVRLVNSNTSPLEQFNVAADVIMKVIVNPLNGDIYIACAATLRRSQDGGTTWVTVRNGTLANSGQFTDIVVTSTGRLYAGFGGTNSAGSDGVWTSTTGNSGDWTRIAGPAGTPVGWNAQNTYGRVVLAIAPSSENLVYALYWNGIENLTCTPEGATEAELFLWNQSTTTWVDKTAALPNEVGCSTGNDPFAVQGGYDLVLAVKPDDPNTVFIGGTNIYRSTDGFTTLGATTRIGGYANASGYGLYANSHPDIHSIVFQPGSSTTMLCGNDGGIQRTSNNLAGTVAWSQINNGYRTYQYYHVALDPRIGNNKVLGGAQDNGSSRNVGGTGSTFETTLGGDGVAVGLSNLISGNTYEYCGFQSGRIIRRNSLSGLGAGTEITPTGEGGTDTELFITYFKLDNDNTENLYYANDNVLYRTTSASTITSGTWTNMTGTATAVTAGLDITAMATTRGTYSPATASLFIGASDIVGTSLNAALFRLNDPANAAAATAPINITSASFPAGAYISSISVNPRNDDTVLVTFSNYGVTSVFWTGNANAATPTFVNVEGNLTLPSFRSSAILVNNTTGVVEYYIGTSAGLYSATIDGLSPGTTTWSQEGATQMGNAVVSSLALRTADNKILIGTHGYAMWSATLSSALPVNLLDFTGTSHKNDVYLNWSTTTEQNTSLFEIEKSMDGLSFRQIGSLNAAGSSNSLKQYNFTDIESAAVVYYRLRIVDRNGNYRYSNVVVVKNQAANDITLLTNPFKDYISLQFAKSIKGKIAIRLFDMSGRLIKASEINQPAATVLRIPGYGTLNDGMYILQVEAENRKYTFNVLKK